MKSNRQYNLYFYNAARRMLKNFPIEIDGKYLKYEDLSRSFKNKGIQNYGSISYYVYKSLFSDGNRRSIYFDESKSGVDIVLDFEKERFQSLINKHQEIEDKWEEYEQKVRSGENKREAYNDFIVFVEAYKLANISMFGKY